ncbi:hypothetical protein CcCBS67573_g10566 [Chytriomyces confervae]|uniref:Uncharacterized protein n=1 Tax=Chytriomyces confervae TaxID=246404 RepID=A0A507CR95_9FUNG|nr:hypothetical protein CcCBS67573_g10566 [Chytriomyces confervae]
MQPRKAHPPSCVRCVRRGLGGLTVYGGIGRCVEGVVVVYKLLLEAVMKLLHLQVAVSVKVEGVEPGTASGA